MSLLKPMTVNHDFSEYHVSLGIKRFKLVSKTVAGEVQMGRVLLKLWGLWYNDSFWEDNKPVIPGMDARSATNSLPYQP